MSRLLLRAADRTPRRKRTPGERRAARGLRYDLYTRQRSPPGWTPQAERSSSERLELRCHGTQPRTEAAARIPSAALVRAAARRAGTLPTRSRFMRANRECACWASVLPRRRKILRTARRSRRVKPVRGSRWPATLRSHTAGQPNSPTLRSCPTIQRAPATSRVQPSIAKHLHSQVVRNL